MLPGGSPLHAPRQQPAGQCDPGGICAGRPSQACTCNRRISPFGPPKSAPHHPGSAAPGAPQHCVPSWQDAFWLWWRRLSLRRAPTMPAPQHENDRHSPPAKPSRGHDCSHGTQTRQRPPCRNPAPPYCSGGNKPLLAQKASAQKAAPRAAVRLWHGAGLDALPASVDQERISPASSRPALTHTDDTPAHLASANLPPGLGRRNANKNARPPPGPPLAPQSAPMPYPAFGPQHTPRNTASAQDPAANSPHTSRNPGD